MTAARSASMLKPEMVDHLAYMVEGQEVHAFLEQEHPGWWVLPHEEGQFQALAADWDIRILIPGNGWGKTTCMALDAELLMQRCDSYKPQVMPEPDRPTTAIWFCQKYQQWEIMAPDVEQILSTGWKWSSQKHYYTWPNGSRLFIVSGDSDWTSIQGIELDAVYFDELPDRKFWNEMQFRRRGKRKTRYMVAATMTQGITWFVRDIIQAWERFVRSEGYTPERALREQPHPKIWMWNKGSILDNPIMDQEDFDHYASQSALSAKELQVRLAGGYADFVGEAVFNLEALLAMEADSQEGEDGALLFVPDVDPTQRQLAEDLKAQVAGGAVSHRFSGLVDPRMFRWYPGMEIEGGRITIYEPPDPEQIDNYVIGADFAAGLEGMDKDAAMVGLITPDGQIRQVAEAVGTWGDVFFAEVLFALGTIYGYAFIVGERQFGLPCLRRLYDEMQYSHLYHQRHEEKRVRRFSDLLGHHKTAGDTIIPLHRLEVKRKDVILVSLAAIEQHKHYQFKPRVKSLTMDDVESSAELIMGAPAGENDDLVMAAAYMGHGARERDHYVRPPRQYRPGSFGDVMKVAERLNPKPKARDPYARPFD